MAYGGDGVMEGKQMSSEVDLDSRKIYPLGWGLIFRVVCAPKDMSDDEISDSVSRDDPPGTSANRWEVSEPAERDDMFDGVNRIQCSDCEDRHHVLMNC